MTFHKPLSQGSISVDSSSFKATHLTVKLELCAVKMTSSWQLFQAPQYNIYKDVNSSKSKMTLKTKIENKNHEHLNYEEIPLMFHLRKQIEEEQSPKHGAMDVPGKY